MNPTIESILIFVGAIVGVIFFISILRVMFSKPLDPDEISNDHIFDDDHDFDIDL